MNLSSIVKRETHVLREFIAFTTNHLERHPYGSNWPNQSHPSNSRRNHSTLHTGTGLAMLRYNFIDDAVGLGLFGRHDEVALDIPFDFFNRLPGVARKQLVERRASANDFLGVDINVGSLTRKAG